ncbi:MAG: hypothetical protein KKD11_03255 [Candidatus Omnitrophica bacterium]|nr:hypothetical protein [Candidatus Omnitrophota bacterium]
MLNRKITRSEFLKTGVLGILGILFAPLLKIIPRKHKEARYYKNLAG